MIRFDLRCDEGHGFDSWFASDAAFGVLAQSGQLACPICGTAKVEKAIMAPAVRPARKAETGGGGGGQTGAGIGAEAEAKARPSLGEPASALQEALAALRRQVEANSEYVGMNFAAEARAIHDGAAPERAIYGEARPDEARRLIEDGVPVAPLPFLPARKAN